MQEVDVEWLDSELEDSPRSDDDIGHMFSSSPNAKREGASLPKGYQQQIQRPAAISYAGSEDVENVEGDMISFYGQQFAPQSKTSNYRLPAKSIGQQRFQDMPVGLVADHGVAAKRVLVRRIYQESMSQLIMSCQAVLVRGASGSYYVYHLEITSDYYKQKWVVCKRYSEFYRLRKRLLIRLATHKKQRGCSVCGTVREQLKDVGFPRRIVMFKDPSSLVGIRTAGLEEFIVALCEYFSADQGETCSEIVATRFLVKEFLQFPIAHEQQHVRSIRQLKYVDPRDVHVDSDSCPICLCEWVELDGNELVLSPCGHFFHEHCINEWYRTRFDCPICRSISGEEENNKF
ncbi:zinc finger-containing partial [Plasmopara halstedii]|uniref:Zinc finger-containing partial n=1 Tax=Plasmopara halstedii TaxID=4781 RepID=A0A0N7L8N2_PLAHL|nr:zinc finger-containing partial [Plasmopara halstedii]CEG50347.1 zinc finger-containing partial [Plasmopara halstedii]